MTPQDPPEKYGDYQRILEYLKKKGVPERTINSILDEEILQAMMEFFEDENVEKTLRWIRDYLIVIDSLDHPEDYKRQVLTVTVSKPLYEFLKKFTWNIRTPEGKRYPLSYLVEDLIGWVLDDPERFIQFIADMYYPKEEKEGEE